MFIDYKRREVRHDRVQMVPVAHQVIHFFLVIIVPVVVIMGMMNFVQTQFNCIPIYGLSSVDVGKPVDLCQCQVADQDDNERYVKIYLFHVELTYCRSNIISIFTQLLTTWIITP